MVEVFSINRDKIVISEESNIMPLTKNKTFYWVRAASPKAEEVTEIVKVLGFDKEDTEDVFDFLKEGDRPRFSKDDILEMVYSVPFLDDGDIITEPIVIYIKDNILITFERKKLPACEKIANLLKKNKYKYLLKKSPIYFVSQLIDDINDSFLSYVNRIADRTDIIASENKKLNQKQIDAISSASTTLAFFNQSIVANIEVLNALKKLYYKGVTKDDREEFTDIYLDALQILDAEKVQREVIMNIFNMQSIISNNQLNEFMKKLTAIALIIMVPTLISGIYGMNIEGLPFASSKYAFFFIIGFMSVITTIIYLIFRKIDWV